MHELPYALGVPFLTLSMIAPADAWLPPSLVPASSIPYMTLLPPGGQRTWPEAALALAVRAARNTLLAAATLRINADRLPRGLPPLTWPFEHVWRAPVLVASVPDAHDDNPLPTTVTWLGALEAGGASFATAGRPDDRAAVRAWLDAQLAAGRWCTPPWAVRPCSLRPRWWTTAT